MENKIIIRQIATLLAGNGLAQILTIAAAPLLTRLYTPEEFGSLALFVALVSAVGPGVCGRYDMAVVVAKREDDRRNLFAISLWIAAFVSMFCLFALLVTEFFGLDNLWGKTLGVWLWVTPIALLLTGLVTALRAYGNAREDYKGLTTSSVIQSAITTFLAIILGYATGLSSGQLYANIIGIFATVIFLLWIFRDVVNFEDIKWTSKKFKLLKYYKDYPLFSATMGILNGAMTGLPVFFLANNFSVEIAGYYALLVRVGVSPLSFISDAVSRVNLRRMAELLNNEQDPVPYLKRITFGLLAIAAVPCVAFMVFAPKLFVLIFGSEWKAAGDLLVILMPSIAIQFVVSTLSLSFIAAGHLRMQALWQVFSFVTTIVIFSIIVKYGVNKFFWAFMLKDVALYILYFLMLVYALKNPIARNNN